MCDLFKSSILDLEIKGGNENENMTYVLFDRFQVLLYNNFAFRFTPIQILGLIYIMVKSIKDPLTQESVMIIDFGELEKIYLRLHPDQLGSDKRYIKQIKETTAKSKRIINRLALYMDEKNLTVDEIFKG